MDVVETLDPFAAADETGLVYVNDAIPGITRERKEKGWVYRRPDGTVIDDPDERARIVAIGIPPAWTHVWISPIPDAHILATGRDSKGRKQYRYHPLFRAVRDATKYHRMGTFGESLPVLRTRIEGDLSLEGLPRVKVLAAAVRLMDETLIRIGNEEYERQNQSYGITTLHHDHVQVDGECMQFEFRAKSGKEQHLRLRDPLLARILHASEELPGQELFQYIDDHGHVVHINSSDVNEYLRATTAAILTSKDFRTWGGSVTAAETLVGLGPPRSPADAKKKIVTAIDAAAARLNNTRAVSRKSYVHPRVPEAWVEGTLIDAFTRAEAHDHLSHSEAAVLGVVSN
ncbi:MAG: topoisomerase [Actinomycetia bacterium]|nr:topoisomerase [Actinomycetes bacterium]